MEQDKLTLISMDIAKQLVAKAAWAEKAKYCIERVEARLTFADTRVGTPLERTILEDARKCLAEYPEGEK